MNKRKRNVDCTDFVTSELQRLSVLPCDWMEEKEGNAIMGYFAMAMERGFPLSPTQQEHFDKLLKENFESAEAYAAAFGEWLVGAIQRSDQDPRFIPIIKAMIGNYYAVEDMLTNDLTQWEQVIAATRSKLEVIAEKGEKEIFEEYDFDTKLGNLGKECFNCKIRLDDPCTGISKELWKEISQDMPGNEDNGHDVFMANMVFVSRSRQTIFKKKMKILAEKSNGRPKAAPVKSDARMEGKLNVDHANEDLPKACANVDCIRLGITYDDVDGIKRGYDMVTEKYKPLRVKNMFRRDFDAKSETFGYRCILVNVLFEEEDVTWGDVLEGAKEHILESIEALGYAPEYMEDFKTRFESLARKRKVKEIAVKIHRGSSISPSRLPGDEEEKPSVLQNL